MHGLAVMGIFTKIDLKTAYHQIPIDNNSKEVTTIDTPIGLQKWKRITYGIKTSKGHQQVLGEDIKSMVCNQNDMYIGATNKNELKKKTDIVLNRLRNAEMTINKKKCVTNSSKISFLNYFISKEGISPEEVLIEINSKNSYT